MEEENKVDMVMPAQMLYGLQGPISSVQALPAAMCRTTTWSPTKSFISLGGTLEDVNGRVRLHVIVSYIISRVF